MSDQPRWSVSVLDSLDAVRAMRDEWNAFLAARVAEPQFSQDPDVIVARAVADGVASLRIVVVRRDGVIEAIAPFVVKRGVVPLTLSVLTLARVHAPMLRLAGPDVVLARDADGATCVRLIFETLRKDYPGDRLAFLQEVPLDGALWQPFAGGRLSGYRLAAVLRAPAKVPILRLPGTLDAFLSSPDHKSRRKTAKRSKRFREAVPDVSRFRATTPEDVRPLLDHVHALFPMTWQAKTYGGRPRNTEAEVEYYRSVAANGWLRSYVLLAGGRPIAFAIGFQYGERFVLDEQGYDPGWSEWGPGMLLVHDMIADLYGERRPKVFDFGFGDADYKRTYGSEAGLAMTAWVFRGLRWTILVRLQQGLSALEVATRGALTRLGLDRAIRRRLKRRQGTRATAGPEGRGIEGAAS